MKLRLDPVFEAGLFNLFHLAGTGTESQTVEGVQNRFLFVQFADWKFAGEIRVRVIFIILGWRQD